MGAPFPACVDGWTETANITTQLLQSFDSKVSWRLIDLGQWHKEDDRGPVCSHGSEGLVAGKGLPSTVYPAGGRVQPENSRRWLDEDDRVPELSDRWPAP